MSSSLSARALMIGAIVLSAVATATAQLPFDAAIATSTTNNARSIRAGDIDGDNDLDLVVANETANEIRVFQNDGTGNFTLVQTLNGGVGPCFAILVDLDADGDRDIAVAFRNSSRAGVYKNTGGVFGAVTLFTVATGPVNIVAADFDNDGDTDLVTCNELANCVSFLFNTGTATFGINFDYSTGIAPQGIVAGDFDGDTDTDLAVGHLNAGYMVILANNPLSGFFSYQSFIPLNVGTIGIAAGDFDGSGTLDIVATNTVTNTIQPIYRTGITWSPGPTYSTGANPSSVEVADLDGDSDLDLVTSDSGAATVTVMINTSGAFAAVQSLTTGSFPYNVLLADVDGDGDRDILTADRNAATFSLFFRTLLGANGAGNTGPGAGGPFNLLTVNGSSGGRDRRVNVPVASPLNFGMAQPPTNALPSDFVVFGQIGIPNPAFDATVLPFFIGTTCIRNALITPGQPDLFMLSNTLSSVGLPSQPLIPSFPTPWTSFTYSVPIPISLTLQGVIVETPTTVKVTNAVICNIL